MDGLDGVSVGEAVAKARPDAIVHQMTTIGPAHAGKPDMRHFDRMRTEGTDHLLAAAEATGVPHVVAPRSANGCPTWLRSRGRRQGFKEELA